MRKYFFIIIVLMTVILHSPLFSQWARTTIANGYELACSVESQDLNGDGQPDLLFTDYIGDRIVMYLNYYPVFKEFIIDNTRNMPTFAYCMDVDEDDTLDILATFPHQYEMLWYKNDHPNWIVDTISTKIDGGDWFMIEDLNNDGRLDAFTSGNYEWGGTLNWYENNYPDWTLHHIDTTHRRYPTATAGDFNGDGLLDIAATHMDENTIVWYENMGGGLSWTERVIDDSTEIPFGIHPCDLNKDDTLDVLVLSRDAKYVTWYEQHDTSWIKHDIDPHFTGASGAHIRDVNGDNDLDIIVTGTSGDSVVWYENNDLSWIKHVIDSNIDAPRGGYFIDIDGDLVKDLVIAGYSEVVWYKNPYTTVAFSDSLDLSSHYFYPNEDSIIITAKLINPEEHSTSIWSLVQSVNTEYKDTVILYDDGTNGDAVAGDDLFAGTFVSSELQEGWFTAYLYTEDMDEDLTVGSPLIEKFTTAGPVIFDSLTIVHGEPIPGVILRFDIAIKNTSSNVTINDLVLTATTKDTNALIALFNIKNYGDLGPGESVTNGGDFYMTILDTCPENYDIKVDLSFSQEGHAYWEDSFMIHVGTVGIVDIPNEFNLNQNFPNPLNPTTTIGYQLPRDSEVELTIYDITGRKIETLVSENKYAGYHTVNWNASPYPSGIYLYRLKAGNFVETKKMVLIK
jgi:hypothetical protein